MTAVDNTPHKTACPANVITNVQPGATSVFVNYRPPHSSDNCAVASTNCSPPSGSIFPIGDTPVTCTAMDTAGAAGNCAFTVTVLTAALGPCADLTGTWSNVVQTCRTRRSGLR